MPLILIGPLAALGPWSVPLFHAVVELMVLCLTTAIFALSWETRDLSREDPLVMVTRGYLWVGLFCAAHFLTYPGLTLLPGLADDPLASGRFWFAASLVESLLFLAIAAPWPVRLGWGPLVAGMGVLSLVLVVPVLDPALLGGWIFPLTGPSAVMPKVEWLPVVLAVLAMALAARPGRGLPRAERGVLLSVFALTVLARIIQCLFPGDTTATVTGHLFKLLSFWALYVLATRVHLTGPLSSFISRNLEWRRMEEGLRTEKERAERYLEVAQVIILGLDSQGRVTVANPHACASLGWSEAELVGADWFERAIPATERSSVRSAFRSIMSGDLEAAEFHENDVMTKDGAVLRVAWHNTVVRDRLGRIQGTLSSGQDVSNQKRIQDALLEAKEVAEEANRAKSDFLASISHELRTPLNAVIGFSEAMEAEILGPMENPTYRDYVSNIRVSGAHLLDLINDILDVSAIEAGKLDLRRDAIDLEQAVETASRMVESRAQSRGITLGAELSGRPPRLLADDRRLRQMLVNLLGNAVKFTPRGGRVSIGVTYPAEGGGLDLWVTDTGPGMSPSELALAMRPFGRVIDPNVPWREGTGLGLPLVDGLIGGHGGRLRLDTAPGQGTRATLWFPPDRVEMDRAEGAQDRKTAPNRG